MRSRFPPSRQLLRRLCYPLVTNPRCVEMQRLQDGNTPRLRRGAPKQVDVQQGVPIVVYGMRAVSRSGGWVGTVANTTSRASDMEVTDTSNNDDEIFTTSYSRQHAERIRSGGKSQDKSGVRKFGLSLSPSSLLASTVFFCSLKYLRLKEKSFSNEGYHFRCMCMMEYRRQLRSISCWILGVVTFVIAQDSAR